LILKSLDALPGKPSSPVADAIGGHVHALRDLAIGAPVGGQQYQLRANDDPIRQRQAARATLKLAANVCVKLDRCRRASHAITFVNQPAGPSIRRNFRRRPLSREDGAP
jgi:hypothetical protein